MKQLSASLTFAMALTLDDARRIASNIAKLPALLGKVSED
jgi:hypothetical protein